jgi:hypothetical protein
MAAKFQVFKYIFHKNPNFYSNIEKKIRFFGIFSKISEFPKKDQTSQILHFSKGALTPLKAHIWSG